MRLDGVKQKKAAIRCGNRKPRLKKKLCFLNIILIRKEVVLERAHDDFD
jgi:hypothetical protein